MTASAPGTGASDLGLSGTGASDPAASDLGMSGTGPSDDGVTRRLGIVPTTVAIAALLINVAGLAAAACAPEAPVKSPETLAVEEKAGDFLDYYEEVLRLSKRFTAQPYSFQAALNELPGTHVTDEEWEAWTRPHRDDAVDLALRLEAVIADLAQQK